MPSPIPLDNFLGALYIGILASIAIYGVTCLQVYLYFTEHCSRDKWTVKTFVTALWVLDTVQAAILSITLYHYAITNFGDLNVLARTTWSLLVQVAIGDVLSTLIQCFFAWRIMTLGKKPFIPVAIVIVLISIAKLVLGGILFPITGFRIHFFARAQQDVPFTTSSLTLDLVCDMLIAAATIYLLRKNQSEVRRTNRAVNTLIVYAMNTCLVTTVCAFVCLVTWVTSTTTLIYAPFFFVQVRLYTCSLMTTLNNRSIIRQQLSGKGQDAVITLTQFRADTATSVPSRQDTSLGGTTADNASYNIKGDWKTTSAV